MQAEGRSAEFRVLFDRARLCLSHFKTYDTGGEVKFKEGRGILGFQSNSDGARELESILLSEEHDGKFPTRESVLEVFSAIFDQAPGIGFKTVITQGFGNNKGKKYIRLVPTYPDTRGGM